MPKDAPPREEDVQWDWKRPLPGTVRIESEVIKIEPGEWKSYRPFEFSSLPNALAKADHKEAALAFVQKYGLLGYSGLEVDSAHVDRENPYEGDPLSWFLAQASTVRFALHLLAMLRDSDEAALAGWIKAQMISVPLKRFIPSAPSEKYKTAAHLFAIGTETVLNPLKEPQQWEGAHDVLAMQLVEYLVNANTVGVRRRLFVGPFEKKVRAQFSARALIEAIWYLVGEAALSPQEGRFSGVRFCEECGTPFIVTDKRQRYCPGDELSGASLCGSRARMRRRRKREEGDTNG